MTIKYSALCIRDPINSCKYILYSNPQGEFTNICGSLTTVHMNEKLFASHYWDYIVQIKDFRPSRHNTKSWNKSHTCSSLNYL